jgi:hypothetical protein
MRCPASDAVQRVRWMRWQRCWSACRRTPSPNRVAAMASGAQGTRTWSALGCWCVLCGSTRVEPRNRPSGTIGRSYSASPQAGMGQGHRGQGHQGAGPSGGRAIVGAISSRRSVCMGNPMGCLPLPLVRKPRASLGAAASLGSISRGVRECSAPWLSASRPDPTRTEPSPPAAGVAAQVKPVPTRPLTDEQRASTALNPKP